MSSASQVSTDQRYSRARPCPICRGGHDMKRGIGERCIGFTSDDGRWFNCSRVGENTGAVFNDRLQCWGHRASGQCECGQCHGAEIGIFRPNGKGRPKPKAKGRVVGKVEIPATSPDGETATYPYFDENGDLLFEVLRLPGKQFRQRRPDPSDRSGYSWKLGDVRRVPYNLTGLVESPGATVWACEGERDTEAMIDLDFLATCNSGGAEKWPAEHGKFLAGRDVVIVAHHDEPGRRHAEMVARSAAEHAAKSIRIIHAGEAFAGLGFGTATKGADVRDLIEQIKVGKGDPAEVLPKLAAAAAPWGVPGGNIVSFVSDSPEVEPSFSGPPIPLVADLLPVPAFDIDLLPPPFAAWLADAAHRLQAPIEYLAAGSMVSLSAVVGRQIAIRPKAYDDWQVVSNLWGIIIGPPSSKKSPSLAEAMHPLRRLIAEAQEAHDGAKGEYLQGAMVSAAKRDAARKALDSQAKSGKVSDEELMGLAAQAISKDGEAVPVVRRYMCNDSTIEKLGELLRDRPNGLLIYRDEIVGLFQSFRKLGHESDRAFYLEGWDGDGSHVADRIERGTINIPHVCLSILGSTQPGPMASLIRAGTAGAGDDGLLARFQMSMFPDRMTSYQYIDKPPDRDARNRAMDIFRAMDRIDPDGIGARDDGDGRLPYLKFDEAGQSFFAEWDRKLGTRTRTEGMPTPVENHLGKFTSLLPSLALLFHLIDIADPQTSTSGGPVPFEAATRAAAWVELLEAHARRIYASADEADVTGAKTLAAKIAQIPTDPTAREADLYKGLPVPFTARDVRRHCWSGLDETADVQKALDLLERHRAVAGVEVPREPGAGGRPASTQYYPNPAAQIGRAS